MNRSRLLGRIALLAALCIIAGGAASANTIDNVRIAADCDGYTLYIEASNFDPGDLLTVEYQFVLTWLGADPTGGDITVAGSIDVTCEPFQPDPGLNTCSPWLEIRVPWTDELGAPISCGEYELDTTTSLGTCDSIASHWSWTNFYGSRLCNQLRPTGWETPDSDPYPDWDGFLSCPCDPTTEICRTAGFWSTHAGTRDGRCDDDRHGDRDDDDCDHHDDRGCRDDDHDDDRDDEECRRGRNITQEVLDAALPPVMVCGEIVDNTTLGSFGSALASMCVRPRRDRRLQLARQLTATALNCVMTNGNGDCQDVGIESTFAECNMACANGWDDEFSSCIDALDCYNNGGRLLDDGTCQIGTCENDPSLPCASDRDCAGDDDDHDRSWDDDDRDDDHHDGDREDDDHESGEDSGGRCIPLPGNCHDQPLINEDLGLDFDPPGPAGSAKSCRKARKNRCTLFGGCGH